MKLKSGTITPAIIVITGAFLIVVYALLYLLASQFDFSQRSLASERALYIAEAGVNYYRWHLAHDPFDFQDGTGGAGPYVHTYNDPEGGEIGEYSLVIDPPSNGSSVVTIHSTGSTNRFPEISRTVTAQYGQESFARFAFMSNASLWYGPGSTVNGDIHSNNGIRMDGTNTGLVTSGRDTYQCGTETGCFPPTEQPGVWGSGGDQSLWKFPVPAFDFDAISFDFAQMKDSAQTDGLYIGKSNASGYHIIFAADGTFNVYKINSLDYYRGYRVPGEGLGQPGEGGCRRRYERITDESFYGTYSVADNPIVFIEDNIWVEGEVSGRISVVAAGFPISSSLMDIWIKNNITYSDPDTDALGLIAQDDIFFVRDLPDDFRVDGALLAQKGQIMRHGYYAGCGGVNPYNIRNSLTINGALISFNKSYWNFGDPPVSGFITRQINYISNLLYSPPPFFPASGEYQFISWKEE